MSLINYLKISKNIKKLPQQINFYQQYNNNDNARTPIVIAAKLKTTKTTPEITATTTEKHQKLDNNSKKINQDQYKYSVIKNINSINNINNNKTSLSSIYNNKEIIDSSTIINKNNNNNNKTISDNKDDNLIIMGYNIDWIFPRLKHPSKFWHIACTFTVAAVGFFSKLIIVWLNKTKICNIHILKEAVGNRPQGVPLITVSNHHSCFDDPGLWGALPLRYVCWKNTIRWSMAAHDICFTNKYHSLFFMFGKCIPVIRGAGVYQQAIEVCLNKLSQGDWVHIFPEGRVNVTKEVIRLKWGVGRIIYESPIIPIVIPIWHEGMDSVLPNEPPYVLKFGKKVTINIGKPIDLNEFIENLKQQNIPEPEARKLITDRIQEEMANLRNETQTLHARC